MGLRTRAMSVAPSVLVASLLLFTPSTASAKSLTATANPSTGSAGVNNTYLTGSGFPAGAITEAVVGIGASCASPALATTPVRQVTSVGALRRFQFLIPGSLAPGAYKVWVSGKAGTTSFNTLTNRSCSSLTVTSSVRGTASLGAAIAGAAVTLVDANGTTVTGTTASDGTFALSSVGLVPPFLVKVVTTAPSGPFPAGTTLYSVSADANASTRINATVLTDLIVRSFYSAQDIDPNVAFNNPTGPNAAPDPTAVQSIANVVIPTMQLWLDAANVSADINLISSPLIAYPPDVTPPDGLDAVLHKITSEVLNSDGSVAQITIAGGTVTETITPSYPPNQIAFTTATLDSDTGFGSGGFFSTIALSASQQSVLDGINATLDLFKNTINTKGAMLTGADLLPTYASDFLNNGATAVQDANEVADEIGGATVVTLKVVGLERIDGNVATANIEFLFEAGADSFGGTDFLTFKNDGNNWVQYGNQRIANISASIQARHGQGGASNQGRSTYVFAGTAAPLGVVLTSTIVGPNPPAPPVAIWNGATSGALFKGAQELIDGVPFDNFFRLSQPLGTTFNAVTSLVPTGSSFTLNLTTSTVGNQSYTERTRAFTTETLQFNGLPLHVAVASVVNQTVTFNFTLPKTFTASNGVFLFAQIFDGLPNNPAAHQCGIGSNDGSMSLNFQTFTGSASITFPPNMSVCGLNAAPIQFINIFLEAEGPFGETSLVQLNFPY